VKRASKRRSAAVRQKPGARRAPDVDALGALPHRIGLPGHELTIQVLDGETLQEFLQQMDRKVGFDPLEAARRDVELRGDRTDDAEVSETLEEMVRRIDREVALEDPGDGEEADPFFADDHDDGGCTICRNLDRLQRQAREARERAALRPAGLRPVEDTDGRPRAHARVDADARPCEVSLCEFLDLVFPMPGPGAPWRAGLRGTAPTARPTRGRRRRRG
jgi:hypothetical protein